MTLKAAVVGAAVASGLAGVVGRTPWRRRRLLILCYHGISAADEHLWDPALYMPQSLFRERLARLRALDCAVLPLGEALERLRAGTLPPRAVALTFDDGARDFRTRALPVLEEFGMPATVYLTTYYSTHPYPVFSTALSYLLWRGRAGGAVTVDGLGAALPVRTGAERNAAWQAIVRRAAADGLGGEEKDRLLRAVATSLGVDYEAFLAEGLLRIMTPEEVAALPRGLIDVQLHTHRHRTPSDEGELAREIGDNTAQILRCTGAAAPLRHFCYPNGRYDWSLVDSLTRLGVTSATTCVPGLAAVGSEPLLLPRFVDSTAMSAATFDAWVTGFADLLPRRREFRLAPRGTAPAAP